VALLPVDNQTSYLAAGGRFGALLAAELQSARIFELVRLAETDPLLGCDGQIRNGRFAEPLLAALRSNYHVDGVLFASLKDVHPYWPPRFAASLHLVDTRSGEVMASVDGAWDAREDHVSYQARQFFRQLSLRESLTDDDLILQSPELMGKFVAHQLVAALTGCAAMCVAEENPATETSSSEPEPVPAVPQEPRPVAPVITLPQERPEMLPVPRGT
jgi:hypothetical protein